MYDLRRRRSVLLAVALSAALGVTACGEVLPTSSFGMPLPGTAAPRSVEPETPAPTVVPAESEAPEPTDTDTGTPGTPPCAIDELKASRGITEVDADERVTEVVLVAAGTCSVDAYPTLLLQDAKEHILVAANPAGGGGIDLVGGVAYSSEVRISNWCLDEPDYPVSIGVVQGIGTLLVTGDSFPDEGDLPPCVHEDADPVLSGTAWQPSP